MGFRSEKDEIEEKVEWKNGEKEGKIEERRLEDEFLSEKRS